MEQAKGFLGLPSKLRKRIYLIVGVPTKQFFYLEDSVLDWEEDARSCVDLTGMKSCFNLLLTSRQVYSEVSKILYSANTFTFAQQDSSRFSFLQNLRPSSISHLTRLTVNLDPPTKYKPGSCCLPKSIKKDCPTHSVSIEEYSITEKWQKWRRAASYLLSHVKPSNDLYLATSCKVDCAEQARLIVEPLYSVSKLSGCSVTFGPMPTDELRTIATNVVNYCTRLPEAKAEPFRFFDLPRELQFRILEYTDLAPGGKSEVFWSPKKKYHLVRRSTHCKGPWLEKTNQKVVQERLGDEFFCPNQHAATSHMCQCFMAPRSLFLVSRSMRRDACSVFFSRNKFVVGPFGYEDADHEIGAPDILEISTFLKTIVPQDSRKTIRSLRIVFPHCESDFPRVQTNAYENWLELMTFMKLEMHLPGLTLSMTFASDPRESGDEIRYPKRATGKQFRHMISLYERIMTPLSKLRDNGLYRFFVILEDDLNIYRETEPVLRLITTPRIRTLEDALETVVMGEDYIDKRVGKRRAQCKNKYEYNFTWSGP